MLPLFLIHFIRVICVHLRPNNLGFFHSAIRNPNSAFDSESTLIFTKIPGSFGHGLGVVPGGGGYDPLSFLFGR